MQGHDSCMYSPWSYFVIIVCPWLDKSLGCFFLSFKIRSMKSAISRLQSEHEQIKVIAGQLVKYTETKYMTCAHESYVIIIHLCTSSAFHMIHRWKYPLKGGGGDTDYLHTLFVAPPSL